MRIRVFRLAPEGLILADEVYTDGSQPSHWICATDEEVAMFNQFVSSHRGYTLMDLALIQAGAYLAGLRAKTWSIEAGGDAQ